MDTNMNYTEFKKIAPALTAALAAAFEAKLLEMGENAKGISWFSSQAK
jgi:hypothetical protein